MAEAIAFDTHRFIKRLTGSGFTEKQAETVAEEHVALLNRHQSRCRRRKGRCRSATAGDQGRIEALRAGDQDRHGALRHETSAAIEAVKAELVKWLFGAPIAQGGLIVALVKLL